MPVLGQLIHPQKQKLEQVQNELNALHSRYQQLYQQNEQLRFLLRTITQGVFTLDLSGKVDYWSRGMELLTGIDEGKALGKGYEHLFPAMQKQKINPLARIIEGERKVEIEISYTVATKLTQDVPVQAEAEGEHNIGDEIPLVLSFLPVKNDLTNLVGIVVEVQNLKDRKAFEEMQLDFVAVVTHELRTPATSIKGYLSLILDEGGNLTEEQKKFLRRAYISNERQIHTIESLLTVSRIEHEFLKPDLDAFQLEPIVAETTRFVREDALNKKLELRLGYPPFTLPKVMADQSYVRQVVYVLLSNAIKFTETGYIELGFREDTNMITFYVKDTGSGIEPHMHDSIFQRFTRGERPFTEDTQGIGLGLYTAKAMVEKMNGTISIESELGKGSIFFVSLPKAYV